MIEPLKALTNRRPDTRLKGYAIMRYWHPDSGKKPSYVKGGLTLEEAQAHCSDPETSFKEGPTENWYFDGYIESSSRTEDITLW